MAAMRFEQVQRFILAKNIFWGLGTLISVNFCREKLSDAQSTRLNFL